MINGKKVEMKSQKIVSGLFDCKPVAINPSTEQMEQMGVGKRSDKYVNEDEGYTRIVIWHEFSLGEDNFILPLNITLGEERGMSSTGKYPFINNKGDLKWSEDLETIASVNETVNDDNRYLFFDLEGARVARKGEILLMNYIVALYGYDTKDPNFSLTLGDYWEDLMAGKVDDLRKVVLGDNEIKMLVMVEEVDQRMRFFAKESLVNQSPFLMKNYSLHALKVGDKSHKPHDFYKNLLSLDKENKIGEYSMSHTYYFDLNPHEYQSKAASLKGVLAPKDDEEMVTDQASALDW